MSPPEPSRGVSPWKAAAPRGEIMTREENLLRCYISGSGGIILWLAEELR